MNKPQSVKLGCCGTLTTVPFIDFGEKSLSAPLCLVRYSSDIHSRNVATILARAVWPFKESNINITGLKDV